MKTGTCLAPALVITALCLLGSPVLGSRAARVATNAEVFRASVSKYKFDGASAYSAAARRLLRSDSDRDLWRAAKSGNATGAEEALEAGADVNAKFGSNGRNPLMVAVDRGHKEVVELLIRAGANVDGVSESGLTPVVLASINGHLDVLLALLRAGASPHKSVDFEQRASRLKTAEARNQYELERALVNAGLEVEGATAKGSTPLMLAALLRHPHIVETLLRFGALVNITDQFGNSPLSYIFFYDLPGRNETPNAAALITGMLIKAGANVNAINQDGFTPLMEAMFAGEYEAMKVLIEAGADLDVADFSRGETALWIAAFAGDLKAVRILVKAGADVSVASKNGRTPLSVVCRCEKHGKAKKNECPIGNCNSKERGVLETLLSV